MDNRVVQIIPAIDWWAEYVQDDGTVILSPLVAWGLLEDGDIIPLETDSDGMVDDPRTISNFVRIFHVAAKGR